MNITKFGHSCVLIEEEGARILLDPGTYSEGRQNGVTNLDALLITHEHADHIDMASVKALVAGNPGMKIFTNPSVKEILAKDGIESEVLGDGESAEVKGIKIEGFGHDHALIHSSIPVCRNTGYFVGGKFFYPGDALTLPNRPVEILGMPTAAPWARIGELIDYALAVKPKVAIPMHDAILANPSGFHGIFSEILGDAGVEFRPMEVGVTYTLKT
ncbi:MAG: MBL fold metallo-hydrolase [Patescibacteria group bacterium]|nr:MBL fold metallo-hydrolase [Patescibacteria group bacterium]